MIKTEQYPNAYKEVNVILQYINIEDVKKIPKEFIDMIKANMNNDYEFRIDSNKNFDQQEILKETKTILAYIFLNYLATDTQKNVIKQKFKQDILKDEQNKSNKYNSKDLFENLKVDQTPIISTSKNEDTAMVVYKSSIFSKLRNWFKNLFSINKGGK